MCLCEQDTEPQRFSRVSLTFNLHVGIKVSARYETQYEEDVLFDKELNTSKDHICLKYKNDTLKPNVNRA